MKKIYLVASLFVAVVSLGCSSSSETKSNVKVGNSLPVNTSNTNTLVIGDNSTVAPTPGTIDQIPAVEMPEGTNANTVKMNRDRKMVDVPGGIPKSMSVPAGENSEMMSTMDKQGNFIETRIFKGHPRLEKVERTFLDPKNSTIKIYLKGGKVVTVSGNEIKDLSAASSITFLERAGIKAPVIPDSGKGTKTN